MNRNLPFFLAGFFLLNSLNFNARAQQYTSKNSLTQEQCAAAAIHNKLLQSDPGYAARIAANEAAIQAIIAKQKPGEKVGGVYTIPVVVHVIHLGEAVGSGTNISTAQIQSAIDNLNDAYRNQSPYTGVDVEVEFCLAQRDPNCSSTTGIVRVNGSATSDYATNGLTTSGTDNEATIKALSKWPNTSYYNIWVVSEIDGNNGGSGTQGFAYFPGANSVVDGAVMLYNSFGYDPNGSNGYNLKSYTNRNVTAIHELGHAFNLYHTFEGDGSGSTCPSGNQCGSGTGDCCADTPPHKRSQSDCNTSGTNSCDGSSSNSLFVHNFMDYSSDACQTEFTANQKTRMRAALESSRNSLVNSLACSAPSGSLPAAACEPSEQNVGNYPMGVYGFVFNTLDVTSGNTYSDGGYVDRTCYFQNTVNAGQTYPVTVKTGTSYNHDIRVYIDYNNDGDFVDTDEMVFSSDNVMETHSGNITILSSPPVSGQLLRMRVYADYYTASITPCANPVYGQAEDFGIKINSICTAPVAQFTASATTICAGSAINFTDQSTNSPTSWTWTINGGSPSSSTSQNPAGVVFSTPGTYTISLTSTNSCGSDGETKTSYITVNAAATASASTDATICSGSTYTLSGSRGGSATGSTWTTSGSGSFDNATIVGATYTPSAADITAGTATLTITTNDPAGPCNAASDAMVLTISQAANANAGNDASITSGSTYTLSGSRGGSATSSSWTTSGTGTFDNASSLTATYTPSVADNTAGSITLTLTTNDPAGPCGTASDQMTLSIGTTTTKVRTADCGITVTSLNQFIYCDAVSGAQDFEWEFVHSASGFSQTGNRGSIYTDFRPSWISGVQYGKTYDVRVRAKTGGVWGSFNTVCQITTPVFPTTKVRTADCGITVTSLNQFIYCDAVAGAQDFEWEFVHSASGFSYAGNRGSSYSDFRLAWVPGIQYGKTYDVRVRAFVGGAWGSFNTVCQVTTPVFLTTKVRTADCGITVTSLNQFIYCDAVAGAQDYEWEFVHSASGFSKAGNRGSSYTDFRLVWIAGIQYGKTYDVRVRAFVGGAWGSFNTVCQVTTPAFPDTKVRTADCGITLSSLSQRIYCDAVVGAQDYEWEFVHSASGFSKILNRGTSVTNWLPSWSSLQYGKTYDVRVRAKAGGVWGNFNTVCQVTTPAARLGEFNEDNSGNIAELTEESGKFNVYPNPGNGNFYLRIPSQPGNEEIRVEMFDIYGKLVYSYKTDKLMPGEIIMIAGENKFAKGVYMMSATIGDKAEYRKVVIQ